MSGKGHCPLRTSANGFPTIAYRANEGDFDEASRLARSASEVPGVTLCQTGDVITVTSFFDGRGYVDLLKNSNGKTELDTFAIPEARDPRFATGFGGLSVHEVSRSQRRADLAYFSYYAGRFRVPQIRGNQLHEVGAFIGRGGNRFWGRRGLPAQRQGTRRCERSRQRPLRGAGRQWLADSHATRAVAPPKRTGPAAVQQQRQGQQRGGD
jgi:hypothetical protein